MLKHYGPRTLWTQDISVPSEWCRSVQTVRHQCRSVGQFGTSAEVSRGYYLDHQQIFFATISRIKERFNITRCCYTQEYTAEDYPLYTHTINDFPKYKSI